jgi:hypothetical protein
MGSKVFMLFHKSLVNFVLCAFIFGYAYGGKLVIAPETLKDLSEQRALLGESIKKLDEINRKVATAKSDISTANDSVRFFEKENKKAKVNLEKKQAYDRDNPGEIVEQLRAAEEKNIETSRALGEAKEKRAIYESELIAHNKLAARQHNEFLKQQKSFEREVDRAVDIGLQDKLQTLQVSRMVEATERVPCGNDPIPVCKERSKKAAEQKASEQGSVVLINSLTEVKNFKLTKDELRSEVRATLSNKTFSNQHLIGETEYETTVTANVEPVVGETLREQIADNIRSDIYRMVGGRVDYSLVQDPDEEEAAQPLKRSASRSGAEKKRKAPQEEAQQEEAPQEEATQQEEAPVQRAPRKLEKPMFTF